VNDGLGVGGGQGRCDLFYDVHHVRDEQATNPTQRVLDVDAGRVKTIPAEEVFSRLKQRLVADGRLRFNPLAEAEAFEAARWYDERSAGLGAACVAAVYLGIAQLFTPADGR
jgi:hypothetical protein